MNFWMKKIEEDKKIYKSPGIYEVTGPKLKGFYGVQGRAMKFGKFAKASRRLDCGCWKKEPRI